LWQDIVANPDFTPEIRDGSVTVFCCNRHFLHEWRLEDGRLTARMHHEHVPVCPPDSGPFFNLVWDNPKESHVRETPEVLMPSGGHPRDLEIFKRRMQSMAGQKDHVQHFVVTNSANQILDQWINFSTQPTPRQAKANLIDLCYYDPSLEKIVFAEVKHADHLLPVTGSYVPDMMSNLKSHGDWLVSQEAEIIEQYERVVRLKRDLGLGDRLARVPSGKKLELLCKPVLIIGGLEWSKFKSFPDPTSDEIIGTKWEQILRSLPDVAAGLIIYSYEGGWLAMREEDGDRWFFGE